MIIENIKDHRFIANFTKYRYLLSELIKRDIKIKYRRSILGIFWSFLQPLFTMIILTIVFGTLFKSSIENYPVYLLTGKLVFDYYSAGSRAAMGSIISNASMIKKVYIPKYMYSLGVVFSNMVTFLMSLIVLVLVMIATGAPFTIHIPLAIVPVVLLVLFTIGAGLILAAVTVFFRDIEHLYGVFVTMLLYATPIMYPADIVPESFRFIQTLNPLYAIIELFRSAVLYGTLFDPGQLLFAVLSTAAVLVLGIGLFYKYQDKFILYI